MTYFEEKNGNIILNVRAVPRAASDGIQGVLGNELKVRIQAPPVEGRANTYLVKFLAKQLKIPHSKIEVISGAAGRSKRLRIIDPPDTLRQELESFAKRGDSGK